MEKPIIETPTYSEVASKNIQLKTTMSEKTALMRAAQQRQLVSDKYAKSMYYDMGGGKKMTASEVRTHMRDINLEERRKFIIELKNATKVAEEMSIIQDPPAPNKFDKTHPTNTEIKDLINSEYTDKLEPENGVRTLLSAIQIPIYKESIMSYPVVFDSPELEQIKKDYDTVGRKYIEIIAVDSKGNELFQGVGVNKKPMVRLKIDFPVPSFGSIQTFVPVYPMNFNTVPYTQEFLIQFEKMLVNGKFGGKEETSAALIVYNDMCTFVKTTFFGKGTVKGMLGRIRVMARARTLYNKTRKNMDSKTVDLLIKTMLNYMPTKYFRGIDLDTPDVEALLSRSITLTDDNGHRYTIPFTRKVNLESNPGPWYSNRLVNTKEPKLGKMKEVDIAFIEPLICTMMMADMHLPRLSPNENPIKGKAYYDATDFYHKWMSIKVTDLFGKGEIYDLEQRDEKTRCINSYNKAPQIPVQILSQPIMDSMLNAIDNPVFWVVTNTIAPHVVINGKLSPAINTGSLILNRLSLFKGTINSVMMICEQLKAFQTQGIDAYWMGVFADNLYVIENTGDLIKWYSLDGVKAESAIDTTIVRVAMRILMNIHARSGGVVDYAYIDYFTNIYPDVVANPIALMTNIQILFPAMGSGVQGTFYFNCVKMMQLALGFTKLKSFFVEETGKNVNPSDNEKYTEAHRLTQLANKVCYEVGYSLTLESVVHMPVGVNLEPYGYYKIDLLGFDMATFQISDKEFELFPILRKRSLYGLVLYRKEYYDTEGTTKLTVFERSYLELIRMRTAFMMGAWYYPALMSLIFKHAIKNMKIMKKKFGETKQLEINVSREKIEEFLFGEDSTLNSVFESATSLLVLPELPTIYELVMLMAANHPLAIKACLSRIDLVPLKFLAPIDVLINDLGIQPDFIDIHIEVKTKELRKLYPSMKSGSIAYFAPMMKAIGLKVVEIKTPLPPSANIKKPLLRTEATTDVGRPGVTYGREVEYKKEEGNKALQVVTGWVNWLANRGNIHYRVPTPPFYVGLEEDIRDEANVAKANAINILMSATGLPKDVVSSLIYSLKNVDWIVKPIDTKLAYPADTEFETSTKRLAPGRLINRQFES